MRNVNPNIDPIEIAKFSQSAQNWWDPTGEFKALHDINPLRIQYIQQNVSLLGKKIVDVGTGGGLLAEELAKNGGDVTGIDMSEAALTVAKMHLLESNLPVEYKLITAEELALIEPEKYDVVTCLEMLEHVPDPSSIVRACAQLVKPGGHIFFSTLNRNVKSYLFAILGAEYILKLIPKNTHDFAKFIRPSELNRWLREADLKTIGMKGLSYDPFKKHYFLSDDLSVNYFVHVKK